MAGMTPPESLHAIIAARLDTLPSEQKFLLQDAAVVGKIFWPGALAAVAGSDTDAVIARLHDLTRSELVRRSRESSVKDEEEYAFSHALIRDVAYGQILASLEPRSMSPPRIGSKRSPPSGSRTRPRCSRTTTNGRWS